MARVVVVEDEAELREEIVAFLAMTLSGTVVRGARDGIEMDRLMAEGPADIVVLDVGLPGEDGLSIAARLRRAGPIGIIMLTARGLVQDRVLGLETGADSYLVKPFDLRELAATIDSLRRRLALAAPAAPAPSPAPKPAAPERRTWVFDPVAWEICATNGRSARLTRAELGFLGRLIEQPGAPVSRNDLVRAIGRDEAEYDHRSLDTLVRRLRRKIEAATGLPLPVASAHAVGYVFTAGVVTR